MRTAFVLLVLACASPALAQQSQSPTFIASASGLATTAAYSMQIESSAVRGFRLSAICIGTSNATAAAAVTVTIQRRSTASTGGTLAANDASTTPSVSALEQGDGVFPGIVRITPTLGTAGPILDQWSFNVGEIGGSNDPTSLPIFCKTYSDNGLSKLPTVAPGTGNGLSINVSVIGSGGLASGSITATIIQPPQ